LIRETDPDLPCIVGEACDDGDACTLGEVKDNNCNCTGGVFQDVDNDMVCDSNEYCSNFDVINNNSIISYNIIVLNQIENNGIVNSNTLVEFIAGNYIELTIGFEVNSNFHAKIESCN